MMNATEILFVALPYAALAALLIGVAYRYSSLGFKVTSLSSQFLEGRQLFWGSQPFHWGILVVFLGHLAAFAIPGTVLAWNGSPLRLLILELTLFAFALSALFGLLALLLRRASNARLRVVTTRMDLVVYLLLAVQIVTGLGVAYFYNWGSSWFAAVLTPYLRSIFVLDPTVQGVAGLPFLVQLHIATAFVIFGMIPYTRLIHFMVFPLNYLWRSYQVVIWHWNPGRLRTTSSHFPGVRSRNN
jgi:nitrate reductase gamma subunit